MSEWSTVALKDIAEINPRESIKKGDIAVKVAMDKLQPFCRDIPEIEHEVFSGGTKFRNGDTIMARITPCLENGKTAMVNVLDDGQVGFGSTEYIVFRAKKGISDPYFLYYLVCSPMVREPAIKSMVGSSGRQRVQTDVVQNLVLSVPPLPEQVKIGEFLKKIDDKIAVNNKINRNLSEQAQAMVHEWEETEKDNIEYKTVADVAELNPDTYSPKEEWDFVNYLDTSSITEGTISELTYIIPSTEKLPSRARRKLIADDIVYSTVRPNQKHYGYINQPEQNMLASTGFVVVRANKKLVSSQLLYLLITRDIVTEKMQQIAEGSTSTFPSIKPSDLGTYEIPVPKAGFRTNLIDGLDYIFKCMYSNQQENRRLADLRDCLLPKLMSGKLDVSDLEI